MKVFIKSFFSVMAYILSEMMPVTELIHTFSHDVWNYSLSAGIYMAIIEWVFEWLDSRKTNISLNVFDNRDTSNKIELENNPRKISINISVNKNAKKLNGYVEIVFPNWIDYTQKKFQKFVISL